MFFANLSSLFTGVSKMDPFHELTISSCFSVTRRCIPRSLNREAMKEITSINKDVSLGAVAAGVDKLIEFLNAKQNFEFMFEDFRASWHIITARLIGGAVASLIWICLMRCLAGIMVGLSLVGMMFVLGFSKFKLMPITNNVEIQVRQC